MDKDIHTLTDVGRPYYLVADALQQCSGDALVLFVEFHTLGPLIMAQKYRLLVNNTAEEFINQFTAFWNEQYGTHF